ncbi:DUF3515 domain-containing protein [Streptomyces sp. URMC 123]|uniref:DUF3515 domain-containing protein n=1 Tax=Streptomyces sp. URMC 123 TaxID=3423403 RepID=UPI003F1D9C33
MSASPHRPPAVAAVAAVCAALLALAGCSGDGGGGGAGDLAAPTPSGREAELCRALRGELPGTVNGLARSSAGPASDFTAAWGEPPVVLRCGVPRPAVLTPGTAQYNPTTDDGVEVNGVGWLLERRSDGSFRFTTVGRKAFVEVTLPKGTTEIGALTDFAEPIKRTVPTEL